MERYHFKPEQVLHIGDNQVTDIESAEKCGVDTFHIWNSKRMLENSYLRKILVYAKSLEDAVIVGIYMAKALNNTFSL